VIVLGEVNLTTGLIVLAGTEVCDDGRMSLTVARAEKDMMDTNTKEIDVSVKEVIAEDEISKKRPAEDEGQHVKTSGNHIKQIRTDANGEILYVSRATTEMRGHTSYLTFAKYLPVAAKEVSVQDQ